MAVTPYRTLGYLGLGKETTQGTAVTPTKFPILLRQAFIPSQTVQKFRTGNQRDVGFAVKEDFIYKGVFETFLYADEGAAILAWAMGADAKTGSSDPYTHTLTLTNALPYLTAEASFYEDRILDRVADCKIAKLNIQAEARKEVRLLVDLMGSSVAVQGSAQTPTFNNAVATEGPFMFYNGVFTLVGPTDAATVALQIQKIDIELDQNLNPEYSGQVYPIALVEQGRMVTVKLRLMFTSDNFHRLIHYGANSGTGVSATMGTGSFAAAFTYVAASPGPERSATLTCGYLNWEMGKPEMDPDGKTGFMDVEASGYRSGANLPFAAVFKNGVSTTYI